MKLTQNIVALTLIFATQFGSMGILLNKHYCKGSLTEVSVLLSNKGCTDDLTFVDRLTHVDHNCHKSTHDNGVSKSPCCDFESTFGKIYLFQEDDSRGSFDVSSNDFQQSTLEQFTSIKLLERRFNFVPRQPPDIGIEQRIEFCRFLI
ncbi:MAG: hypothetical protein ACI85F_002523 [Bacteroidia bacterium]|jgi:hypothetical protein